MLLTIFCVFLLTTGTPAEDSCLQLQCQEQGINTSVCSVYQTLYAAWLAQESHKSRHYGYLALSVLANNQLTVSEYEKTLNCQLPASPITDSTYRITVAQIADYDDTTACSILVIGFFNSQSDGHLPLANFRYNMTTKTFLYQYITPDSIYELTY
jgi:hypothetical protein